MIDYTQLQNIRCEHSRSLDYPDISFHLHDQYEIYLFIAGNVQYFVEHQKYVLEKGDLLIFNSNEIHKPTFPEPKLPYERGVIHFPASVAGAFSSPSLDLLRCFDARRSGEGNFLHPTLHESQQILHLLDAMIQTRTAEKPGWEILFLSYFLELLTQIANIWGALDVIPHSSGLSLGEPLTSVISYIQEHLSQDLSLESLGRRFFINKNYLCTLFRRQSGNTIHNYILHKRVALAKELLLRDKNVTEVCALSGFNDYSNFIRSFRQITGVSPARFKKSSMGLS